MPATTPTKRRVAVEVSPAGPFAIPNLSHLDHHRCQLEALLDTVAAVPLRKAELNQERAAVVSALREAEQRQAEAVFLGRIDADALKDATEARTRLAVIDGALGAADAAKQKLRAEIAIAAEELAAALGDALAEAKVAADQRAEDAMRELTGAVMFRRALDFRWAAKPALAADGTTPAEDLNRIAPAAEALDAINKLSGWRSLLDAAAREGAK